MASRPPWKLAASAARMSRTDLMRCHGVMQILVIGATGVAGSSTVPVLVEAGHHVSGHARTEEKASVLRRMGAEPVMGDAEDTDTLLGWLRGKDAVVDLRVQIPSPNRSVFPSSWREYVHLRDSAAGMVVDCAIRSHVPLAVHDTITMMYADGGERTIDEGWPVDAPGPLAANLAAERHLARLTEVGGRGVALRFGQFYGPVDVMSHEVLRRARRGQGLVLGDPAAWSSALHTDDIGPAVLAALGLPAGVYNVVDEQPLRRSEVLEVLAAAVGRPSLRQPPSILTKLGSAPMRALARSQRVSAERFREASGWRPRVPSRRVGWPAAAEQVRART